MKIKKFTLMQLSTRILGDVVAHKNIRPSGAQSHSTEQGA